MAGYRNATPTNVHAGQQMTRTLIQQLTAVLTEALAPMRQLASRPDATPAEAVAAVHKLRSAAAELDRLKFDLVGAAVLSGVTVGEAASRTGLSGSVLTRRLRRTPARLRGQHLVPAPEERWGWRPL